MLKIEGKTQKFTILGKEYFFTANQIQQFIKQGLILSKIHITSSGSFVKMTNA